MDKGMKTRWISLYVENQVGVLSKISGLFSGKSYNLDSLTVGTTEDPTVSRMTIATVSDDETFEQIKKQNTIVLFGGTSNGNRTHDFALRGQRLDRLTMEANGWGTRIRT